MPERTAVAGGPQTAVRSSQTAGRSSQFAVAALYGLQAASPVFWAISPSRRGLYERMSLFCYYISLNGFMPGSCLWVASSWL